MHFDLWAGIDAMMGDQDDFSTTKSRVVGSLLGLAVCDAIGTTVEFMPPGSFDPVQDMVGGGKFNLLAGQVAQLPALCAVCNAVLVVCSGQMIPAWLSVWLRVLWSVKDSIQWINPRDTGGGTR